MPKRVEHYIIRINEVDNTGGLSLPALVNLLQEIAWNHAQELGVSVYHLLEKDLTWILVRMSIELQDLPHHRETLTIETWPSGIKRHFVFRDFILRIGNRQVGRVVTSWLVFDTKLRTYTGVPDYIRDRIPSQEVSYGHWKGNLKRSEQYSRQKKFEIRFLETDLNRHVNNTAYFQWLVESIPANFLQEHSLRQLEIAFKAESLLGEEVFSRSAASGPNSFLHQIANQDNKELARAFSVWS